MKTRRLLGLLVFAVLLAGCVSGTEATPTIDWAADYVPVVAVTGEVVPAVWANISAQGGGTVIEVLVEPGGEIAEGDVLLRIDSTDARLAVQQAQAALATAQAQLEQLQAGARAEEIAAAQAQVDAAEAAVSQAAAQLDQLSSGALEAEVAAAEAQVAAAEAEQRAAREAHDKTLECFTAPDGSEVCPLLGSVEEQARYALQAANEALEAAQAQLDALEAGAADRLAAARAAVAAAAAQRDAAQAQLDLLQAGASDADIAVAQAAVVQAEASLATAQVALDRAEVRAPFDGTIGAVHVRVGELVVPGQPLITLGDLDTLRVETTDLDEIDVAQVTEGQQVNITFDALPEEGFVGRVTRISPMATPGSGGVNYTVVIELDEIDPVLRWGMTAFVDIEVEE